MIARLRGRRDRAGPGQADGRGGQDTAVPGAAPLANGLAAGSPPRRGRASRPRRDPWRMAFFCVLLLAALAGGAWALLASSLLAVRHEVVTGNRLVPASEVLAAAGIRYGTPLISVNTAAAGQRVERIDQVLSATVSRSWPDTIVISVRERTPVLAVPGPAGFALVDGSGVTVRWARRKPPRMVLLTVPPGQLRGNPAVVAAAAVLRELTPALRGRVVSMTASSAQDVRLRLRGAVLVVWGGPGAGRIKAQELLALLHSRARYYDVSDPATVVTRG